MVQLNTRTFRFWPYCDMQCCRSGLFWCRSLSGHTDSNHALSKNDFHFSEVILQKMPWTELKINLFRIRKEHFANWDPNLASIFGFGSSTMKKDRLQITQLSKDKHVFVPLPNIGTLYSRIRLIVADSNLAKVMRTYGIRPAQLLGQMCL